MHAMALLYTRASARTWAFALHSILCVCVCVCVVPKKVCQASSPFVRVICNYAFGSSIHLKAEIAENLLLSTEFDFSLGSVYVWRVQMRNGWARAAQIHCGFAFSSACNGQNEAGRVWAQGKGVVRQRIGRYT